MMSTSVSPITIKAMEGLTLPANITSEHMEEFLSIWMNISHQRMLKNVSKAVGDETISLDNCTKYCDHHMRDFFTEYKMYHGYVTLVVSACVLMLITIENTQLFLIK